VPIIGWPIIGQCLSDASLIFIPASTGTKTIKCSRNDTVTVNDKVTPLFTFLHLYFLNQLLSRWVFWRQAGLCSRHCWSGSASFRQYHTNRCKWIYTKFNTLPIPALHNCQILQLVHKFTYHHDKLPAIFSNYFTKNYTFHSYNTHIKDSLHMDLFASSLDQRSIKYKGSILWNTLPEDIKAITSTVSFVNKLHKILL